MILGEYDKDYHQAEPHLVNLVKEKTGKDLLYIFGEDNTWLFVFKDGKLIDNFEGSEVDNVTTHTFEDDS